MERKDFFYDKTLLLCESVGQYVKINRIAVFDIFCSKLGSTQYDYSDWVCIALSTEEPIL